MSRSKHGVLGLVCAVPVLLATLTGCGNDEGANSGGALSLDRLTQVAEGVGKDGAESCPLPYDAGKASDAVGLRQDIAPGGAGAEADEPVATAEGGKTTDPQSVWAGKAGALITCSYHVGGEDLEIFTIGTAEGRGAYALAPTIQSAGSMGQDELKAYTEKAATAKPGEAVPSESGNVVTVRLDAGGKGDVALVLTAGEDGKTSLQSKEVVELATTFAAQAK